MKLIYKFINIFKFYKYILSMISEYYYFNKDRNNNYLNSI